MFHDARQLPTGTRLETELCIIGAGAAGITLALSLRDAGFRVLLLESGGLEFEESTQALYSGDNTGLANYDLDASRLRHSAGGSTNHWAQLVPAVGSPRISNPTTRRICVPGH